jgi:hypothetical protein
MGLIFIDSLHIDLVIPGMGSNELHPSDSGPVLHLHNQTVPVPRDVKNHPVVAANAGIAVLVFDVLRPLPTGLRGFVIPALQSTFGVSAIGLIPKCDQATFGNHPHSQFSHFGRILDVFRLNACPVEGYTGTSFLVDTCVTHLHSAAASDCLHNGCLARRACPVGADLRYTSDHAAFHMQAFAKNHPGK